MCRSFAVVIVALIAVAFVEPLDNESWYTQSDSTCVIRVKMIDEVPVEGFKYDHDGRLIDHWKFHGSQD